MQNSFAIAKCIKDQNHSISMPKDNKIISFYWCATLQFLFKCMCVLVCVSIYNRLKNKINVSLHAHCNTRLKDLEIL